MLRNVLIRFAFMASSADFLKTVLVLLSAGMLLLLSACTEYERNGVNCRPFNEPTYWEQNPYGNAFRN